MLGGLGTNATLKLSKPAFQERLQAVRDSHIHTMCCVYLAYLDSLGNRTPQRR